MKKRKHTSDIIRAQEQRDAAANKRAAGLYTDRMVVQTRADAERLMALIPDDTRDTTGVVFGDPLFERSALYKKLQA